MEVEFNGSMRVIGLNIEVRLASSDEESDDVGGSLSAHSRIFPRSHNHRACNQQLLQP